MIPSYVRYAANAVVQNPAPRGSERSVSRRGRGRSVRADALVRLETRFGSPLTARPRARPRTADARGARATTNQKSVGYPVVDNRGIYYDKENKSC